MSQPYIFISDRCPHSNQIVETLKGLNKMSLYRVVTVESLTRPQLAGLPFLKKVPTLYVPDTKEVVVGKDIFGFISKPTNARNELPTKAGGVASGGASAQITGDISAWGFEGTHKLGESYSLWNDPGAFTSDGNSMYTFLGGAPTPSGPAGPQTENTLGSSKSGTNSDVAARMEALQKQRENEFAGIQRR